MTTAPVRLVPFIPSGPDFDLARRFFAELGFAETWCEGDYAGLRAGDATFILQRLDDAHFAGNLMLQLFVPDLDAWWEKFEAAEIADRYPGVRAKAPADQSWGLREAHLIDPAGVCWHVIGIETIED